MEQKALFGVNEACLCKSILEIKNEIKILIIEDKFDVH